MFVFAALLFCIASVFWLSKFLREVNAPKEEIMVAESGWEIEGLGSKIQRKGDMLGKIIKKLHRGKQWKK